MNVKEIIEQYLKENGFDGLFDGEGCGCKIEDLTLCEMSGITCRPGYLVENKDFTELQKRAYGGDTDWIICPEKP